MEVLCLWTLWTPCRVSQGEEAVVVWGFYKYGRYTRNHQLCPSLMKLWPELQYTAVSEGGSLQPCDPLGLLENLGPELARPVVT